MPKGVYERTPEILEKIKKNLEKATEALEHGENCNCAMCRGMRGEYSGKGNPRYKHGNDVGWYKYHKEAREKIHLLPPYCERCGTTENLRIHHKDHNIRNNDLSNLEHICRRCHRKEHHKENRGGEQRPCDFCGKLNWYVPSKLDKNKHFFCNRECYDKWRKNSAE